MATSSLHQDQPDEGARSRARRRSPWDYEARVIQRMADQDLVIVHLTDLLNKVADWVCEMGYPIDFGSDAMPPAGFRPLIQEAWVRRDSISDDDAESIRALVAEEGRWA